MLGIHLLFIIRTSDWVVYKEIAIVDTNNIQQQHKPYIEHQYDHKLKQQLSYKEKQQQKYI